MDLNFAVFVSPFLCFDHPIVINAIAKILIKGCSKAVNRRVLFAISPNAEKPTGETKYKTIPISN